MYRLIWILISTIIMCLISFIGVATFILSKDLVERIIFVLVALAAGAFMGNAFLHLIPEAVEESANYHIYVYVLVGFVLFFLIEKILHWRHCHKGDCKLHTFAYMNLIGDGVHNFVDGLIIATSFVTDIGLGIITTIAVGLHEIPQEMGDFAVLVYGGYNRFRALFLNFICALTVIIGGLIGHLLAAYIKKSIIFLLPFAAGGFIYIAASDLLPEIKKEPGLKPSLVTFGFFMIGILVMYMLRSISHS